MLGIIIVKAELDIITGTGRLMDQTGGYIYCESGWISEAQVMLDLGYRPRVQLNATGDVVKMF